MERLEERFVLAADLLQLSSLAHLAVDATLDEMHVESPASGSFAAGADVVIKTSPPPDPKLVAESLEWIASGANLMPITPFPLEDTFFLHSLPGATKTIYLDFDGHTTRNTPWNTSFNLPNIVTPAFSLDDDYTSFSDSERLLIQEVWERVAEDFRPFEVNVTTQDPGVEALRNTGVDEDGFVDEQWGIRVVIGGSTNDWYTPITGNGVGGVAMSSFTWDIDVPAFAFAGDFGASDKGIAEVISHEVGHTLGLGHDGQYRFYYDLEEEEWVRVEIEYYPGHGSGPTGWAPIMGVGYSQNLTQWSQGEYFNADNIQDDLFIITTQNGFGYRADDHGDTMETATPLGQDGDEKFYFAEGIIERNTDVDYFSFTVEGFGELLSFDINPFHRGPNLDILARLYNSSGVEIATSNPVDDIYAGSSTHMYSDGGWRDANGQPLNTFDLGSPGSFFLTAGTYYLTVEGTGRPIMYIDPIAHPPPSDPPAPNDPDVPDDSDWGYTDYGSLGYYSITGMRQKGLVVGVDFDVAGGASPQNWNLYSGGGPQTVLSNLITETGEFTPFELSISTTGTAIDSFASANPIDNPSLPAHAQPLDGLDGYITAADETLTFVWGNLAPSAVYQVYVFGHADIATQNDVTIVGGEWNGVVQTANFMQLIAPNGLVVNDDDTPGNEELAALSYFAISDELGRITISVTNQPGYAAAIAGLAIAPTKFGSIEGQKWNDRNGDKNNDADEEGLAGWIVYLDLNNNGQLDLISTPEVPVTATSPEVPQEILDLITVKNDLFFPDAGVIVDVDVQIHITHTYAADLNLYLISPSGTRVTLFEDVGAWGENFHDTILDDQATRSISSVTPADAPFTGRFRPQGQLSDFNGEDPQGTWTLEIFDDAPGDIGVLNNWSITVTLSGADIYLEPVAVTDANGNYSFTNLPPGLYYVREHIEEHQILEGWRQTWEPPAVTVASGARVTGIDIGNWIPTEQRGSIQGQKWEDVNGDGVNDPDEPGLGGWIVYIDANDNGVRDIASEPVTAAATDLPKPISENLPPTRSQVTFDGVGTVLKVEVTLDITHSYMADLDAHLTSPSGRTVRLFSGAGGQFNNFENLTLADDAERSIQTIDEPDLPYTGRWRPEGLLSDFLGEVLTGSDTWTLTIQDTALADQGTLDSWSLTITLGELFVETDGDGNYLFENLPPGQYVIREEQRPGWVQVPPATAQIPGAVWDNSQWTVTIVGLDDPDDPDGPDSRRNVKNVDFGNRAVATLAGDYGQRGTVDAAAYTVWRDTLGATVAPFSGADGNGNGVVDQLDYDVWKSNFGATLAGTGGGSSLETAALAVADDETWATSAATELAEQSPDEVRSLSLQAAHDQALAALADPMLPSSLSDGGHRETKASHRSFGSPGSGFQASRLRDLLIAARGDEGAWDLKSVVRTARDGDSREAVEDLFSSLEEEPRSAFRQLASQKLAFAG